MGLGIKGWKMESFHSLLFLVKPLGTFLVPVPTTLSSAGFEVLVPEWGVLLPGATTNIPLNWKLRLPPGYSGLLMPLNQQAKEGIKVLGGVIDPDYRGEIWIASPQWR
jgi:dUTPase